MKKAALLYDEIDRNPLFHGTVAKEDRSKMNVCFVMDNEAIENAFLQFAKENEIVGIKKDTGFPVALEPPCIMPFH
jgi:phosphoserine aminotransferase